MSINACTASTIMDGQRIYYNFIRPHMALNGKTPAECAEINTHACIKMPLRCLEDYWRECLFLLIKYAPAIIAEIPSTAK